jgi:phage tail sheath protein FI
MPVTPTYPGVYIEEIPSGVRTIVGVATSVTAFLGRASGGPTNDPTIINSFSDFERIFGGLHADYPLSYAVRDFYLNGGAQAVIVRLFKAAEAVEEEEENGNGGAAPAGNAAGVATIPLGDVTLSAASPGSWADTLAIKVDYAGIDAEAATRFGVAEADLFNLTIVDVTPEGPGQREVFRNVSLDSNAGARRLDRVLAQSSRMARLVDAPAADLERPAETPAGEDPTLRTTPADAITYFTGGDDGVALTGTDDFIGSRDEKTGMYALAKTDIFNLLCIPADTREGDTPNAVYQEAMQYCVERRAMLIVDPPADWADANDITANNNAKLTDLGLNGTAARNAALYFPRIKQADPKREGQIDTFVPCGVIAGVMARTDVQRGVWKAPAGLDAALNGVAGLAVNLNDAENGMLNPLGINCLRSFPVVGRVVWGARTLRGADRLADEYKYVPVRRLALYIEESLYRGTQWAVFEPNDEPLWAQLRLNIGAFMQNLFRQGAFQGSTPREAYLVKCDKETTTQNDINLGIVNVVVGFAPLKPAEFVIIKIQQLAGQIEV